MPRSHDKECFYKFMTSSTAKSVLESSSLRWTKPSNFNDPFDHQVSFQFPYTQDEFASALATEIEKLVYGAEPTFTEKTLLSQMVQQMRARRDQIPKEEVLTILFEGAKESADLSQDFQNNINTLMSATINQARVLCVTEHNNNVVMWSHYADSHKGVCIRLQCIDEIDNNLLVARPVTYTSDFPVFLTLEDQINHLTGTKTINTGKLMANVAFMKHEDWEYENEWRIHRPHETGEGDYNDWTENPIVFGAIYFGCKINEKEAQELFKLVESKYPHMEIYQAKPSAIGFKIEYEKIK